MNISPTTKTIIAIFLFSLAGIISFVMNLDKLPVTLPLFIFYVLFMINSFFSIRLFFGIIPEGIVSQTLLDLLLAVVYFILAFSQSNPPVFAFFLAFFFVFGSMKYVFLLPVLKDQPRLLKRKILANTTGILLGLIPLAIILLGFEMIGVWTIAIAFAIANVFIFFISPLYKLDSQA